MTISKSQTPLHKGIPVNIGRLDGFVFGGPYRSYIPGTRRLIGIKMAAEINHDHDFAVDTEDFSVPPVQGMQNGLVAAINAFHDGKDVYVGCMGGIGRTGLFMGCMAKVMADYATHTKTDKPVPADPVAYVRAHYMGHAIETLEQQVYVRGFNTAPVIKYIDDLLSPTVVSVEVPVPAPMPTPLQYAMYMLFGVKPK